MDARPATGRTPLRESAVPGPALPDVPAGAALVAEPPEAAAAAAEPPAEPLVETPAEPPAEGPDDPLTHPDPARAADAGAVESLLRCWVRETGLEAAGEELTVPLTSCGTLLRVPVRYWSATGHHRFGPARLDSAPPGAAPVDALTLAALLSREAAHGEPGEPGTRESAPPTVSVSCSSGPSNASFDSSTPSDRSTSSNTTSRSDANQATRAEWE
jgi:hypothetical protein